MQGNKGKKPETNGPKLHPDAYKKFYYKNSEGKELAIYNARNGSVAMTIKIKNDEYRQSLLTVPLYIPPKSWTPKEGDWIFRNATMQEVGLLAQQATIHQHEKKPFVNRKQRRHYELAMIESYIGTPVAVRLDDLKKDEQPVSE